MDRDPQRITIADWPSERAAHDAVSTMAVRRLGGTVLIRATQAPGDVAILALTPAQARRLAAALLVIGGK